MNETAEEAKINDRKMPNYFNSKEAESRQVRHNVGQGN